MKFLLTFLGILAAWLIAAWFTRKTSGGANQYSHGYTTTFPLLGGIGYSENTITTSTGPGGTTLTPGSTFALNF